MASPPPKARDAGARQRLIEATAKIMADEGYAAATSRRVAAAAGVKQALVYYYFPTMDDLYVEVLRTGAETSLERMRTALTDEDPLRTLWMINSDLRMTGLNTEFMALANHRKAIRAELRPTRNGSAISRPRRSRSPSARTVSTSTSIPRWWSRC